jgi:mono/diheme cytochrome c family protein
VTFAGAVALLSWAGASLAAAALPPGVTQQMVQQGDTVFHGPGRCFKCHGPDGKGTQKGPSLVSPKKWTDIHGEYDEIVQVVNNGVPDPKGDYSSPMPARTVAKLSDEDVRAVAAYVWTISR